MSRPQRVFSSLRESGEREHLAVAVQTAVALLVPQASTHIARIVLDTLSQDEILELWQRRTGACPGPLPRPYRCDANPRCGHYTEQIGCYPEDVLRPKVKAARIQYAAELKSKRMRDICITWEVPAGRDYTQLFVEKAEAEEFMGVYKKRYSDTKRHMVTNEVGFNVVLSDLEIDSLLKATGRSNLRYSQNIPWELAPPELPKEDPPTEPEIQEPRPTSRVYKGELPDIPYFLGPPLHPRLRSWYPPNCVSYLAAQPYLFPQKRQSKGKVVILTPAQRLTQDKDVMHSSVLVEEHEKKVAGMGPRQRAPSRQARRRGPYRPVAAAGPSRQAIEEVGDRTAAVPREISNPGGPLQQDEHALSSMRSATQFQQLLDMAASRHSQPNQQLRPTSGNEVVVPPRQARPALTRRTPSAEGHVVRQKSNKRPSVGLKRSATTHVIMRRKHNRSISAQRSNLATVNEDWESSSDDTAVSSRHGSLRNLDFRAAKAHLRRQAELEMAGATTLPASDGDDADVETLADEEHSEVMASHAGESEVEIDESAGHEDTHVPFEASGSKQAHLIPRPAQYSQHGSSSQQPISDRMEEESALISGQSIHEHKHESSPRGFVGKGKAPVYYSSSNNREMVHTEPISSYEDVGNASALASGITTSGLDSDVKIANDEDEVPSIRPGSLSDTANGIALQRNRSGSSKASDISPFWSPQKHVSNDSMSSLGISPEREGVSIARKFTQPDSLSDDGSLRPSSFLNALNVENMPVRKIRFEFGDDSPAMSLEDRSEFDLYEDRFRQSSSKANHPTPFRHMRNPSTSAPAKLTILMVPRRNIDDEVKNPTTMKRPSLTLLTSFDNEAKAPQYHDSGVELNTSANLSAQINIKNEQKARGLSEDLQSRCDTPFIELGGHELTERSPTTAVRDFATREAPSPNRRRTLDVVRRHRNGDLSKQDFKFCPVGGDSLRASIRAFESANGLGKHQRHPSA